MTAIERLQKFNLKGCLTGDCVDEAESKECPYYKCELSCETCVGNDIKELLQDSKLQEQYVTQLESYNEKLRKIVNILCDTISQLIE